MNRSTAAWLSLATLLLAGCGETPIAPSADAPVMSRPAMIAAQSVPPANQFVTIQATVKQLLPDTHNPNNGLDHQNFVVVTTAGQTLDVNNDTTPGVGSKVPNLQIGERLTIRGVEYHDPGQDGIHWTHHDVRPNDAGFIETPDGQTYQ